MGLLRRLLVLAALVFWQGGATFYAFVVVPSARAVLRPPWQQAFVTRQVTGVLNAAAAAALVLFVWDVAATRDPSRPRRLWRWGSCVLQAVTLAVLVWLHSRLAAHIDTEGFRIVDADGVRPVHRAYLGVAAVQWVGVVIYVGLTLAAWRAQDERSICLDHPGGKG
jgi:hypothetical protein